MAKRRGNGEGSIYKDSDNRWRAQVDCGCSNGKRKRKKFTGRTRAEVADKLNKALNDQKEGVPLGGERQTLASYLEHFLMKKIKPKRAYKTFVSYSQQIRDHIAPTLGKTALINLSATQIDLFLTEQLSAGLSPRTVQYQHAILRAALNEAVRKEIVKRNVAALVQGPTVRRFHPRPYSRSEAQAFLNAFRGERLEAVYSVAVACGLRQGETLGLSWSDIDFEGGKMHIRQQLQRDEFKKLSLTDLKTEGSVREIELPQICISALRIHQSRQISERQLAGNRWVETGLVFTTTVGTGVDQRNLLRRYYAVVKASGLRRIRFHDLRHTAATLLLAMGLSMNAVSKILGHSDIRTTMNIYGGVLSEEKRNAANLMDGLFLPVAPEAAPEVGASPVQ